MPGWTLRSGPKTMMGVVMLVFAMFLTAPASGEWVQVGTKSVNRDTDRDAWTPAITTLNGVPHVVWCESNGNSNQVYVRAFDSGTWNNVGGSLNEDPYHAASDPEIVASGNMLYVGWHEVLGDGSNPRVFVKRWDGNTWSRVGTGPLNYNVSENAYFVSMDVADNGWVYAVWCEGPSGSCNMNISHWAGGPNWVRDGGVGASANIVTPDIVLWANAPYVTWPELSNIYVKILRGGTWYPLGGALNDGTGTAFPVIAHTASAVHVAWHQNTTPPNWDIITKHWEDPAWTGSADLNINQALNAEKADITVFRDVPYISWREHTGTNYQIHVKYLNGTTWESLGSTLNVNADQQTDWARLGQGSDALYCTWQELGLNAKNQVYVKRWDFPVPTLVPTATPTSTPTPLPGPAVRPDEVFAYPQPASSQATFAYHAPNESGEVEVLIFNTHYRRIERLSGQTADGSGQIVWDTSQVPSGVYFYRVTVGGKKFGVRKLVVAR